ENAAHLAFEVDGTIAVGPPDILATAVTGDGDQLILMPGRSVARHDVVDLGSDNVPYLGPALAAPRAQSARMPFRTHRLAVGIVVELDQFGAPPDEHRVARRENE